MSNKTNAGWEKARETMGATAGTATPAARTAIVVRLWLSIVYLYWNLCSCSPVAGALTTGDLQR